MFFQIQTNILEIFYSYLCSSKEKQVESDAPKTGTRRLKRSIFLIKFVFSIVESEGKINNGPNNWQYDRKAEISHGFAGCIDILYDMKANPDHKKDVNGNRYRIFHITNVRNYCQEEFLVVGLECKRLEFWVTFVTRQK